MGNKGSKSKNKGANASAAQNASNNNQSPNQNNHSSTDEGDVALHNESLGVNELKSADPEHTADSEAAYSFWDRNKTYVPPKELPVGSKQATMQATMKATLGGGDVVQSVKLPPGEELNEWLAVNTVHFFNAASMIYGTCSEFCTESSCPSMSAGRAEYLWKDNKDYKKPTRVPAPKYMDLLLNWIDEQISDPKIFPVDENTKFPRNFQSVVKNIYKRLFRLYAHIYCSHSEKIRSIGANAHLNTCFKHFIYFVQEFNLMDKADLAPLEKLIAKFRDKDSETNNAQ